jgi:hypothetical protein
MLRLGKISTEQRAKQAAGVANSDDKSAVIQPEIVTSAEPTLEEVIF